MSQSHAGRVAEFFAGRHVLVTGATGFLGKVLVEKILRSLPDVGRLYLLMRPSTKETPEERFNAFLSSAIFDRLRAEREGFDGWARTKLVLVASDLTAGRDLGIAPSVAAELRENVSVVLHCAATVDFNEPLHAACRINVLGSLHLLNMAKSFRHLAAFVHVSTAYVNSNVPNGTVNERIYPMPFGDSASIVDAITSMNDAELEALTTRVLSEYPNTYTFTKSLAEHMLLRHRDSVPLSFVRPTIIGCSAEEPVPGWIDAISAAAACLLFCGMGVIHNFPGSGSLIADLVPVDYVSNLLLAAATHVHATTGSNADPARPLPIFHSGTSERNPVLWDLVARATVTYWRANPTPKRISHVSMRLMSDPLLFQTQFFLSYDLPSMLYSAFAAMTLGTNPAAAKTARRLKKMTQRARALTDTFRHFVSHEWIFDASAARETREGFLTPVDVATFFFDERAIHWPSYVAVFCYGLQRHVLKERVRQPCNAPPIDCLIAEDVTTRGFAKRFPDLAFALKSRQNMPRYKEVRPLTPAAYVDIVLSSPSVRAAVQHAAIAGNESEAAMAERARAIATRMAHTMSETSVRAFGFALRKIIRRLYRHVLVDTSRMAELRRAMESGPVALLPTHRSYLDFLILSYVLFSLDLPVPVICAGEDFLGMGPVATLLRNSGAFFIRRSFNDDVLYRTIFAEYVRLHVERPSHPVEFFVEGTRSRTGKSLRPRLGMLSQIAEPVMEGTVPDVRVFPVGISYDRIVETNLYATELLGVPKPKESAGGLVRARSVLSRRLGRIHVRFAEPISVRDAIAPRVDRARLSLLPRGAVGLHAAATHTAAGNFIDPRMSGEVSSQSKAFVSAVSDLAFEIVRRQQASLVATAPAIVAAVLLNHSRRAPETLLGVESLVEECAFVRSELEARGISVDWIQWEDARTVALGGVDHMKEYLIIDKDGAMRANVTGPSGAETAIVLANWRNQLLHTFATEGTLLLAMRLCKRGAAVSEVADKYKFVAKLMRHDIVGIERQPEKSFDATLAFLSSRGAIAVAEGVLSVKESGHRLFDWLDGLFTPLADSYWAAVLHLYGMLHPGAAKPLGAIVADTQRELRAMHTAGQLSSPEAASSDPIKNAFHGLRDMGVLEHTGDRKGDHVPYKLAARFVTRGGDLHELFQSVSALCRRAGERPERLLQTLASKL